jgi:hypothetical protein
MEPEGSLLRPQKTANGPYPSHMHKVHNSALYFLNILFILAPCIYLDLPSKLFPSGPPTNIIYATFFSQICGS